ncbi:MAG: sensor histidine kinase [Aliihoeflea sp.]|uniref:sensor histidine kinase n=1 Tax=Aliihoeflea sp. TaxID=2608088 RepID=UPI004033EFAF
MRRQLAFFAAALCLPLLAFMAYILFNLAIAERERLEARASEAARDLSAAIDRELLSLTSALEVLAVSPQLQSGDIEAFHAKASQVDDRLGFNAVLRTPDGQQLVNLRRPFGSELPRTPQPTDADVLASDEPLILDLFDGPVAGEPLFAVTMPIVVDGEPRYILSLAVPATRIRELLLAQQLPESWTVAAIDNNDRIVARSRRHEEFVGEIATDDLRANTAGYFGSWNATTVEGEAVFGTYSRSLVSDWRIAIGVMQRELNAPAVRFVQFFVLLGLLALGLSALLASLFARRLAQSATGLAAQAHQLADGEPVTPRPSRVREFSEIGAILVAASERLRGREADLKESEAKFRAIADTMPQMVWSTTPDGLHDYYNARWYEFTGVPVGSTDGEGWNGMFHPDDQPRAWEQWSHSLRTGEPYDIEYRLRHHSGEYRWTLGRALPIRDDKGRIIRWFGTCTDVHETKIAAEEREVVAQELSHRIKNIFSVLGSIVGLTARTRPEAQEFAAELRARILALGTAHEFVRPRALESSVDGHASLHGLLRALLAAYDGDGTHVSISGPDLPIAEGAATPLALVFHELGTNAAKYGGFSGADSRIEITTFADDADYHVTWKEHVAGASPSAEAASDSGFGSRLIELSIRGQMGGTIERIFEPDGLRVEITVPVWALSRAARLRRGV